MSLQQSVLPFPSHPLGWIPETNKFYDEKDSTEVQQKIVNVWFDTSKDVKKFTLSEEDSGALVRLDLSQRWADPITSTTTPADLIIELPVVKSIKPLMYTFDFSMLDAVPPKMKYNIKIKITPNQGIGYTKAVFTGGCFSLDGTTTTLVPAIDVSTGASKGKYLQISTDSTDDGIHPNLLSSCKLTISSCGMRDWTKYNSQRFDDATYSSVTPPNGDPVFWHVAGAFFGNNTNVGFTN